jgi:tetratricopeptide (TPR) repeat protein
MPPAAPNANNFLTQMDQTMTERKGQPEELHEGSRHEGARALTMQASPDSLLQNALSQISGGDFARAAKLAEEVANLHGQAGRTLDQALALQVAGALQLASADAESSRALSQHAARIVPENLPVTVASLAVQAEAAATQGRYCRAVENFTASLDSARAAGIPSSSQVALLRRRAACRIAIGDYAAADGDFTAACQLASARIASFLRAEQSRLLFDAGQLDASASVLPEPNMSDAQLIAEIEAQKARLARATGDTERSREHAIAARSAALSVVAPVPYFTASVELAEALDALGRRADSYSVLATTWASLSDLLGSGVARSWIEPCMLAMRLRWGDTPFNTVKQAHDARRRAEPGAGLQ